jgi:DNA-binding CsgD family transcriptional regulator
MDDGRPYPGGPSGGDLMAAGPVVVGRDGELDVVRDVLDQTTGGKPTLVLLGGDAGVGKTAFAQRVAQLAAGDGFQVLTGACLSVESGVPFAPVVEALRPLLTDHVDRLGPAGPALAGLLPGPRTGSAPAAAMPAGQLLELLLAGLAHLADVSPVLLVLEDMHWADMSTRELALHLARSLRGPVCLLLSYRSDDLHRRHPLRRILTELGRSAQHVDLGPLDREAMGQLLSWLTKDLPDAAMVGAVLARSGGNPLFAEELVAAHAEEDQLPARLADLLLARIDALSRPTARLLRLASAGGPRVDTQLLALVTGQPAEEVEDAAREAVDFNVLALRSGSLEFRHELLREAAYDDLLPGERTRVHGRLAAAMQDRLAGQDPDGDGTSAYAPTAPTMNEAAQIAYHWNAAMRLPDALRWSLTAGRLAGRLAAPEATGHLERVLELWDQVPDAAEMTGTPHAEVLLLAAEASDIGGHLERAFALLDRAATEVDEDAQPLLASRIFGMRGSFCGVMGDAQGRASAVDRAVQLAEGTPSVELAGALAVMAARRGYDFRLHEAVEVGRRAAEVAAQVGAFEQEAQARQAVGWALIQAGSVQEGVEESRRGVELAARTGRDYDEIQAAATHAFHLFVAGRPQQGIEITTAAAQRAVALGLRWTASFCVNQRVEALMWTGRFDDAEISLREMVELEQGLTASHRSGTSRLFDGMLRLWRGDLDGAVASLAAVTATKNKLDDFSAGWEAAGWLAQALARQGSPDALAMARQVAAAVVDREGAYPTGFAATTLLGTLWLNATDDPEAVEVGVECARRSAAASTPGAGTESAGFQAEALAWVGTATGSPDPGAWERAVAAWEAAGFLYAAAQARAMHAHALLAVGERDAARAQTVRAFADADAMGARWLAERVGGFARRARFPLQAAAGSPSALDVLTPREREVLALLADGASNRVIADRLVISQKTAGVHVSNLLAKLGVGSRLEAAAIAHRSGLTAAD